MPDSPLTIVVKVKNLSGAAHVYLALRRCHIIDETIGLRHADALDVHRASSGTLIVSSDPAPAGWVIPPGLPTVEAVWEHLTEQGQL